MRTKQRPPSSAKHTHTTGRPTRRNPGAALLSGAANGNTHPAAIKKQKNDDLPPKTAVTSSTSTTLPTKERPWQPNYNRTQSSLPCFGRDSQKKTITTNWLWKFSQWRRLNRGLRFPCSRPPKPELQAITAQSKQQGDAEVRITLNTLARSIRSMQLLTSTSESSPSPPSTHGQGRRAVRTYRTRRYLNQLQWYRALRNEKKQAQRLAQQSTKTTPSSAYSSVGKGTSEGLNNRSLKDQREKRKRGSPSAHGPLVKKESSQRTKRKLWRRQLDSSSTDSPASESSASVTPVCARCLASSSRGTLTCPISGLKKTQKLTTSTCTFSLMQKTTKSPRPLKVVKFEDLLNHGNTPDVQIPESASRSKSSVSKSRHQSRLPSTPHICKKSSKRSSASFKHKVQANTPSDPAMNGNCHSDKSDLTPKVSHSYRLASQMIPSPRHAFQEALSHKDPHQRKKSGKHVGQITSNDPSETEARLQAHPQTQLKTPSSRRSEKAPASREASRTFKRSSSASQGHLKMGDNCTRRTQTPFRQPDTPRPKSCPGFLKWKKVLEQRSKRTRPAARSMSSYQVQSPVFDELAEHLLEQRLNRSDSPALSKQLAQKHGHTNKPALGNENSCYLEQSHGQGDITERQHSVAASLTPSFPRSNSIQTAAQNEMIECHTTQCPSTTLQIAQEHGFSSSCPELTQAIFSAMRFFLNVQPVEAESASLNSPCHPSPSPDTLAFGMDARQRTVSQRTSLSGCQYYAVAIKPLELTQPFLGQDACGAVGCRSCRLVQGGEHNHTQMSEQALSEREDSGRATEPHAQKTDKVNPASKRTHRSV